MSKISNPILSGFYPDPSICRVGDTYYLANSSFSYTPGVPVFESKDLKNWNQIGHVLDRPSQLNLDGATVSEGIYAPCIRYHDGTFYCITTNVSHGGNFYVTAKDPAGPWSDPVYLEDADGIDPTMFFDEDGKCYYIGTKERREGAKYFGDNEIWLQEIDLEQGKLVGESTAIWHGALKNVVWPEGPHLYKIGKYYYVMIAEAGTDFEHCITIARSENLRGPYEGYKCNPIFTHRHLGRKAAIQKVGHGDLVETPDGEWYMVMLAMRMMDGAGNMGRETFLAKVEWENDWPVVNPCEGKLTDIVDCSIPEMEAAEITDTPEHPLLRKGYEEKTVLYDFAKGWDSRLILLRGWQSEEICHKEDTDGNKKLILKTAPQTMRECKVPAFVGIRQDSFEYCFFVQMEFTPTAQEYAGIILVQNEDNHMRLEIAKNTSGKPVLRCVECKHITGIDYENKVSLTADKSWETELASQELDAYEGKAELYMESAAQSLACGIIVDGEKKELISGMDATYLSTDKAGGFVGSIIGVYATAEGQIIDNTAKISQMKYWSR